MEIMATFHEQQPYYPRVDPATTLRINRRLWVLAKRNLAGR
jgi:hypothetical protein